MIWRLVANSTWLHLAEVTSGIAYALPFIGLSAASSATAVY